MKSTAFRFSVLFTASLLWLGLVSCSQAPMPSLVWSLNGTVWKLTELNNAAVGIAKLPSLQLDTTKGEAKGFTGINQFTGSVTLNGAALKFGPLAMTRMAGSKEEAQIEASYSHMLDSVTAWQIDGPILSLLAGENVVARFRGTPAQP